MEQATLRESATARRYVATYFICLAIGVGLCIAAYLNQKSYRRNPIDFSAIPDGSYVPTRSLTLMQREEIKLGHIERAAPPRVGMFGNHQMQFMTRRAFGPDTRPGYFFNYYYANLGLPELYDYMSYLADRGKLPTELLVVQITTPNNDAGAHILTVGFELPPDLLHYASNSSELAAWMGYGERWRTLEVKVREDMADPLINRYPGLRQIYNRLDGPQRARFLTVEGWIQNVSHFTHQSLNYATLASALASYLRGGVESRVVNGAGCTADRGDLVAAIFTGGASCSKADLHMAYENDGSLNIEHFKGKPLRLNETEPLPQSPYLRDGDEVTVAAFMDRIFRLAQKHGRRLVFLIPPVYEESGRQSGANTVMSKALALVPHIPVIDDREGLQDPKYYFNYDHPAPPYFERLVAVLRQRGFLGPLPESARR
jgi:hypothetical protein